MLAKSKSLFLGIGVLLVAIWACGSPPPTAPVPKPVSDPTTAVPLATVLVTVWGPDPPNQEEQLILGATVDLIEPREDGDIVAVGETAEEVGQGRYRLLNVPAGERMFRATKPPENMDGFETINVVISTEPNEVEIHMVMWSPGPGDKCAKLPKPLLRFRCIVNQNVAPPGDPGVYDPGLLLAPTATP